MNYTEYLKLDKLLSIQNPLSTPLNSAKSELNETLFIVTHQSYELWFKQLILEITSTVKHLSQNEIAYALEKINRINIIAKSIVSQMDVIFTLKAADFQEFRGFLGTSSGFQSYQFSFIEYLLANANSSKLDQYKSDPSMKEALDNLLSSTSLWSAVKSYLQSTDQSKNIGEIIRDTLKQSSMNSIFLNKLLDLDLYLQDWRFKHIKLVERTISGSSGTGGSAGASYLKKSLERKTFEELWLHIDESSS